MKGTVVFDMIGTCFSLAKPREQLTDLGAPAETLPLWFAQTLRDAFALSHAGRYQPLQVMLEAELPRTLELVGVDTTPEMRSQIMATFTQLELHPDALDAFELLHSAEFVLVALTNGSEASTHKLLAQANALSYFSEIISCDRVQKTKPHPEVYSLIPGELNLIWLVAAHAWDIMGAQQAGFKTAFVARLEKTYLSTYSQPDIETQTLITAAEKILVQG